MIKADLIGKELILSREHFIFALLFVPLCRPFLGALRRLTRLVRLRIECLVEDRKNFFLDELYEMKFKLLLLSAKNFYVQLMIACAVTNLDLPKEKVKTLLNLLTHKKCRQPNFISA